MSDEKIKIRLQGHEKFALREGWLNKGLQLLPDNPDAFTRKDAPDQFGMGSNMVKSLRYWMRALGLTKEKGSAGVELTEIGELVNEHDPYIEDRFTLWILHSNIAKNRELATSWYMYFNHCDADDLDKKQVEGIVLREITKYAKGQKFSEKSVGNDVDVVLHMYCKTKDDSDPEEKNVSPFSELELIKLMDGKYYKNHPVKNGFSEYIVLYEIACRCEDENHISIDELIYGDNGLANIYNLTGVLSNELLDRLANADFIDLNRTAGIDEIYYNQEWKPVDIVDMYYRSR